MKRKGMPQAKSGVAPKGLQWDLAPKALELWSPGLRNAADTADSPATISVMEPIGYDPWTGTGVTLKRIDAALRSVGETTDVKVNINSPGGDLFEGIAIYNRLREHKGNVLVSVLGLAASAASVIAMAGDQVHIARSGFLMIHNTWVMAMGNRNDMRAIADQLEPFDAAMADVYSARSGIDAAKIAGMMDAETWINGTAAVDQGFADELLPADQVQEDPSAKSNDRIAAYLLDLALAKAGMPRSSRRELMREYKGGTSSAAAPATEVTPSAGPNPNAAGMPSAAASKGNEVEEVLAALRSFRIA